MLPKGPGDGAQSFAEAQALADTELLVSELDQNGTAMGSFTAALQPFEYQRARPVLTIAHHYQPWGRCREAFPGFTLE